MASVLRCKLVLIPVSSSLQLIELRSAWALDALGNVQIDRGELESALILYTESMELNESILGSIHLKTAASYHKVAWLLWKRGELTRAM